MTELNIVILGVLVMLSAFFSAAEVALVSISEIKLKTMLKRKKSGVESLRRLKEHPQKMIVTILIGNNIVNISAAALATVIATEAFGSSGLGIATGVMTLVILVFGEIIPKTFANSYKEKAALIFARPVELLSYLLYPLVLFFSWLSIKTHKIVKFRKQDPITEAEMKTMLEFGLEKKIIEPQEKYVMERAFKLNDITAYDIMTPGKDIFSLNASMNVQAALDKILKNRYSRIPIYTGNKKNITGIVHVKDLFEEIRRKKYRKKLKDIAAEPIFVQKDMIIGNLLKVYQHKQTHMAIVENKKGIIGLATLEDIVEELVGEITDESDITPETIVRISKNTIIAHGNTLVEEVNTFFNTALPVERKNMQLYELILKRIQKPKPHEKLIIGDILLILEDVRDDEILKVRLTRKASLISRVERVLSKRGKK